MINLYHEMEKKKLKSKMLLQVHDELVFEVPDAEMSTLRKLVPAIMESAIKLSVPVKVDTKVGKNWGDMK
jgi:DNA polymerase-1